MSSLHVLRRVYLYTVWGVALGAALSGLADALQVSLLAWVGQPAVGQALRLARDLASLAVGAPVAAVHWLWAARLARQSPQERAAWTRAVALHGAWGAALLAVFLAGGSLLQHGLARALGEPGGDAAWLRWVARGVVFGFTAWSLARIQAQESGRAQRVVRTLHGWLWWWGGWALLALAWRFGWQWVWEGSGRLSPVLVRALLGAVVLVLLTPWWRRCALSRQGPEAPWCGGATLLTALTWALLAVVGVARGLDEAIRLLLGSGGGTSHDGVTVAEAFLNALFWGGLAWGMTRRWARWPQIWPQIAGRRWQHRAEGAATAVGLGMWLVGLGGLWMALFRGAAWNIWWSRGVALAVPGSLLWAWGWRRLSYAAQEPTLRSDWGRRGYLYFALFVTLMLGMIRAGDLLKRLFEGLLGLGWPTLADWLEGVGHLALAAGVAWWHWMRLRQDEAYEERVMGQRMQQLTVLLLSDGTAPLLGRVHERLRALLPQARVVWYDVRQGLPEEGTTYQALVLTGGLLAALERPWRLWLERFAGERMVLPTGGPWTWLGAAEDEESLVHEVLARVQALLLSAPGAPRVRWWQWAVAVPLLVMWATFWLAIALA